MMATESYGKETSGDHIKIQPIPVLPHEFSFLGCLSMKQVVFPFLTISIFFGSKTHREYDDACQGDHTQPHGHKPEQSATVSHDIQ